MTFQSIDQNIHTIVASLRNSTTCSLSQYEASAHCLHIHKQTSFQHLAYLTSHNKKDGLLTEIMNSEGTGNTIVYVRTSSAADKLAEHLNRAGITAEAIHGNKSQRTKTRSLLNFRDHLTRTLVVTDSAVSGMDVTEVSVIINYDLPLSAETYMQRLSYQPALAGLSAKAFSLCDESEKGQLKNISRVLRNEMQVLEHSFA